MQSYNPPTARCRGLGSSHFARHYSGNHDCFLFLPVLRCFSSRGWLSFEYHVFNVMGWPIRRSRDVMLVCSSPWLIAAYHVLLRLSDPRHPPCALNCFKKIKKLEFVIIVVVTRPHFFRPTKKWCVVKIVIELLDTRLTFIFPICQRADSLVANKQMCWTWTRWFTLMNHI